MRTYLYRFIGSLFKKQFGFWKFSTWHLRHDSDAKHSPLMMATPIDGIGSEMAVLESSGGKKVAGVFDEAVCVDREDGLDRGSGADFTANDQRDMQRMGKTQQFRVSYTSFVMNAGQKPNETRQRNFRMMSTIGFTICVTGTWVILLTYACDDLPGVVLCSTCE